MEVEHIEGTDDVSIDILPGWYGTCDVPDDSTSGWGVYRCVSNEDACGGGTESFRSENFRDNSSTQY